MEAALKAGRRSDLALLFIDLDRFREINAALGYAVGDELLKTVARRLRGLLDRGSGSGARGWRRICRCDGGPAERYLDELRQPYRIVENDLFVTASVGVAIFPIHGETRP